MDQLPWRRQAHMTIPRLPDHCALRIVRDLRCALNLFVNFPSGAFPHSHFVFSSSRTTLSEAIAMAYENPYTSSVASEIHGLSWASFLCSRPKIPAAVPASPLSEAIAYAVACAVIRIVQD